MEVESKKMPWHYELYLAGHGIKPHNGSEFETNICKYSRCVFGGFLWAILYVVLGTLVGLMAIEPIVWAIQWIFTGSADYFLFYNLSAAVLIADAIVVLILVSIATASITTWLRYDVYEAWAIRDDMKAKPIRSDKPGFIKTWWTSVADKVCLNVKIKG